MIKDSSAILKKQTFAINTLLPFFVSQMDSRQGDKKYRESITKRMAEMEIFPYITLNGTKYGKLSESGISWYYCKEGKNANAVSTESYRILDKKKFNQTLFEKVQFIFAQNGFLQEFSDKIVLDALIKKMAKEKSYTETWWRYATDAFKLWDRKTDLGTQYKHASQNINDAFFLFDDSNCEPEFREMLIKNHVYLDIKSTQGFKKYMSANPGEKEKDKTTFLKYLGIPSSFIKKEGWDKSIVDDRILEIFKKVGKFKFPVLPSQKSEYELCRLSEYIIKVVFNCDQFGAKELLNEDDEIARGIAIRNIDDAYMSCHYSLFYLANYDKQKLKQDRMNMLLVEHDSYDRDLLRYIANDVEDITNYKNWTFDELNVKKLPFYIWAWQLTNNKELLNSILYYFNELKIIDKKYQEFVFDILDQACDVKYNEIGEFVSCGSLIKLKNPLIFNIETDSKCIIRHYHTINALKKDESSDVSFTIFDAHNLGRLPDLYEINKRIIDAVKYIVPGKVYDIESDSLWSRITLLDNDYLLMNTYGMYALIHQKDSKRKIDREIVLLAKHEDRGSYLVAISNYIADKYGIILNNITTDWKEAYGLLAERVNNFLSNQFSAIKTNEYISFPISYMNDVPSLKGELEIWERMNYEKKLICKNSVSESHFEGWRQFLDHKYHGRCQLCGKRTVTGTDRAHFWTYRIAKERENSLANMNANMFCLCPTCHGELSYGYNGRDLTSIKMKAKEYVQQLEICMEENPDDTDTTESIISDFADQINDYGEFHMPVVCSVIVNGRSFKMKFSWEHFIQLAFLLKQAD